MERFRLRGHEPRHEQGLISDPVNRNKSIWLTEEGLERGRQIAERLFGKKS
ncbi:DUF6429 family protein [Pseudomonas sp. MPDS]|uniref:DUF6429 family protein n=1 Tax=Pseudomonas sp. MPDS TaxID=2762896 RepID=UPI00391EF714